MNKIWSFLKLIPTPIQLILVGAVVFFVTDAVMSIGQKDVISAYIEQIVTLKKENIRMIDSVKKEIGKKDEEIVLHIIEANDARAEVARLKEAMPNPQVIAVLRTKIDSLKKATTDSVVLARTVIPAQDNLIKQQDSTITIQRFSMLARDNENTALRKTNGLLIGENHILKTTLDSVQTVFINMKPPKNTDKIFFGLIPKPTRTQAVIAGFVGGLITYRAVIK